MFYMLFYLFIFVKLIFLYNCFCFFFFFFGRAQGLSLPHVESSSLTKVEPLVVQSLSRV